MISLHDWQTIRRRCLIDKEPIARVAAETGYSRTTLRKYLNSDAPPSRQGAPTRVPQLEKYSNDIDLLLRETPDITAVRIQHLLKERYLEFSLRERAVRRFVAKRRGQYVPREVFIRQVYQPGDQAQYDFCDVQAQIKGEVVNMHLFSARLSYSTAWFARCYYAEDQPALFDGIAGAAAEFGGVTADGVFDNATTAIDKVLKGRDRKVNATFAGFIGSYATTMQYAAPRKGNEKGGVEGVHGYIRDNFFRPLPSASSLEELNNALLRYCREERSIRKYDGVIIADRLEEERLYLRPLPSIEPRPCTITHVKINKFSEVRFKTNRYSVPSQYAGRLAAIEVFATHIRMIVDHECIAEHERIFGKNLASIDPMHYVEVLERKHRAVERAEMLNNPRVPIQLRSLLRKLVDEDRDTAGKKFMRVWALLRNHSMADLVRAVDQAHQYGVTDPDAIALLLVQDRGSASTPLSMDTLPEKAKVAAPVANLACYETSLLAEAA